MKIQTQRRYQVKEVLEAPRGSHMSYFFPSSIYSLLREEDGRSVQVVLPKSLGWKPGQIIELDDLAVESARAAL